MLVRQLTLAVIEVAVLAAVHTIAIRRKSDIHIATYPVLSSCVLYADYGALLTCRPALLGCATKWRSLSDILLPVCQVAWQ